MRKQIVNGYIVAIGEGISGEEISRDEYDNIMSVIKSAPKKEGYGYRLKEDLTWEEYQLPNEEETPYES